MSGQPDPYQALGEAFANLVRQVVEEAIAGATTVGSIEQSAMVDVPEAARRLGLGQTTVKKEIAAGRLRSCLAGRRRLIPVEAISDYANMLGQAS